MTTPIQSANLWTRIQLLLVAKQKRTEPHPDIYGWQIETEFKKFMGVTYILKRKSFCPPPLHHNCRCTTNPILGLSFDKVEGTEFHKARFGFFR